MSNLCNTAKAMHESKFIALSIHIRNEEKPKLNDISFYYNEIDSEKVRNNKD